MANYNRGRQGEGRSSSQNRGRYSNDQDFNRGQQSNWDENRYDSDYYNDSGTYRESRNDRNYGNYDQSAKYNQDYDSGYGTGYGSRTSNRGGSYEGGYSNPDYRDSDYNQGYGQGNSRREHYSDRNSDRSRSNFGSSNYGSPNYGTAGNVGYSGSGSSHYSSDFDRYGRGQGNSSLNRFGESSGNFWGNDQGNQQWGNNQSSGEFRGKGPKGYQRSDERIKEDINDRLSDDPSIDASDIEVTVTSGEVTLSGTVQERRDKRRAEDIVEAISGVKNVENRIRLQQESSDTSSRDKNSTNGNSKTNYSTDKNKSKQSSAFSES
jgi:osmotically-inducible protein OsmY